VGGGGGGVGGGGDVGGGGGGGGGWVNLILLLFTLLHSTNPFHWTFLGTGQCKKKYRGLGSGEWKDIDRASRHDSV